MNKEVIISIRGSQSYADVENEVIELVTSGTLSHSDAGYSFSYMETELTGLDGTVTTFQVEKNRITLLRLGEVNSQMVFEEGRKHFSMYETPYGSMTVGVSARKVQSSLSDTGGNIELVYAVEIDHAIAGENIFQINVREAGKSLPQ
ncbi:MAG: DUF1934 domain-containing protein [Oscillospiraceae bacterium]|nr:DUF1934 domain-containing protein [Oscillospiraceae bacterium]